MLVYRIEHPDSGKGPYKHNGKNSEEYGICGLAASNRPMPYNDGLSSTGSTDDHRFGFRDTKKLAKWFSKEDKQNLAKHGFVCRVYKIPMKHVKLGSKQLTFDITKAKLVRKSRVIPSA